ncbi:hypothetical protein MCEGE10_01358 [Flavobacteriaceae bacterium]
MKKIILAFIATSIVACSSDNNGTTNQNPTSLKLSKITRGTQVTNFTYQNGLLSKITTTNPSQSTEIRECTYENSKIKQIYSYELTSAGATVYPSTTIYSYTGNKITSDTNNENGVNYSDSYTYTNDVLTNRKEFHSSGTLNTNYDYEYFSDGNLKKETQNNNGTYITNYNSYDSKNNYFKLIFTNEMQLIHNSPKNNVLTSDNYTFEYEYNSANYPTKITKKNGAAIVYIENLEYQ